ncbi:MAG: hypothetical protein WCN95_04080 [bacterium]
MTKRLFAYAVSIAAVVTSLCAPVVAQVTQTVQAAKSYNVENATLSSLRWLKEKQNKDGSWGSNPTNRPALTGLAILAYSFYGETVASKEFGVTVQKGLRRLLDDVESSKADGRLGGVENEYISTEAIVTYALAEAYGMTLMTLLREPTSNMTHRVIMSKSPNPIWAPVAVRTAKSSDFDSVSGDDMKRVFNACLSSVKGSNLLSRVSTALADMQLRLRLADEVDEVIKMAHFDWNGHHESLPVLTWYFTAQVMYHRGGQTCWEKQNELLPTLYHNQQADGRFSIPVSKDGSGEKEKAMWGAADSDIYATSLFSILLGGRYCVDNPMTPHRL